MKQFYAIKNKTGTDFVLDHRGIPMFFPTLEEANYWAWMDGEKAVKVTLEEIKE